MTAPPRQLDADRPSTRDGDAAATDRVARRYVTFASEEGALRCLQTYPPLLRGLAALLQGRALRLQRKTVVRLRRAEEPRDLYWENLGLRRGPQLLRRLLVLCAFCLLLLASSGVVYWAEASERTFEARFPTPDCFPSHPPRGTRPLMKIAATPRLPRGSLTGEPRRGRPPRGSIRGAGVVAGGRRADLSEDAARM